MVTRINSYLGIMRFADARNHKFRSLHECALLPGGLRLPKAQQKILPIFPIIHCLRYFFIDAAE